jgi:hypothetical protein
MPKKITDITKKVEDPANQGSSGQPEQIKEMPGRVEIEKKVEIIKPAEVLTPEKVEEKKEEAVVYPFPTPAPTVPAKSPALEKIEDVLEEDLEEFYFQLPAQTQAEFRAQGEEIAPKIAVLLSAFKVQVKKILELIIKWLRIIPHVNKYFLEQEAKIKTDKLLELKEKGELKPEDKNKM